MRRRRAAQALPAGAADVGGDDEPVRARLRRCVAAALP